jgi:hypothetical protein
MEGGKKAKPFKIFLFLKKEVSEGASSRYMVYLLRAVAFSIFGVLGKMSKIS